MKKVIFFSLALGLMCLPVLAQEEQAKEVFEFTTITELPITPIKNQNLTSTCWSFSSLGYFESELLRIGKGEYDLAEMFVVHKTMEDRALNYVRLHGDSSFLPGGSFYDVVYCLANYGIVPQEVMPGNLYGGTLPVHNELDAVAEGYVNALVKGNLRKLTPVWRKGLSAIYDTYLGACPETFTYQGIEYTPLSFAESLGLNLEDYVSLTSYTHHPFYTEFSLEIPDNWRNALSYNLPLDELMEVMDNAIATGYTFAWGSDTSEMGFTRTGIGVVPDVDNQQKKFNQTTEQLRAIYTTKPCNELEITQELRQEAYDNWETTDDHGMLVYGLAKDQNGKEYFMVKNSWGEHGNYKGIWYASKAYVAYKTMNILVHKDALPKHIAKKLNIK